jgi:hypothetical protein
VRIVPDRYSAQDNFSSHPSAIRIEDILAREGASEPRPHREGLPATFRMRADAHYVDMIEALPPRIEAWPSRAGLDRPDVDSITPRNGIADAAALSVADAHGVVSGTTAEAAAQADRELAESLSALGACANILAAPASRLTQSVAANLIRAEVWRAACLLQASRVMRGEVSVRRTPVSAQAVVDRVLTSIEPERRLRGVVLDVGIDLADSRIQADEELLVVAVSGLLMATFGLVGDRAGARVGLTAHRGTGGAVTCAVTQDLVSAAPAWGSAPGERVALHRSEGGMAAVAVVGARRVVEGCDGRLSVDAGDRGTRIELTIPSLPASSPGSSH